MQPATQLQRESSQSNVVPQYIADRIRQRPPAGIRVVPGSTPVVAFGDVRSASVATLGLNPSKNEFLDSQGHLLEGNLRRLETISSLRDTQRNGSSSCDSVARIFQGCNEYFRRRPYHRWFNVLEK